MDITYQYMKKRCDFGRQPLFCDQGPDMCDSIATDFTEHKNYILRNPVHEPIQNTPQFSENYINTIRAEYTNSGNNHAEGGWPKDIQIHDPEAVQRYRRKVEKEDTYIHCAMTLAPGMEHYVLQNNAIDMYRTYFVEMPRAPTSEHYSCRTINIYRDQYCRPVSNISWQPKGHRFSTCYINVDFYRKPRSILTANIWDVNNANSPDIELEPPAPTIDLKFNPRDSNFLVGGLTTGQVVEFDTRAGVEEVNICPPHVAHRDVVRQVVFIHSKTGKEYFSGSADGAVKWWDSRNLSKPTDEMIIDLVKTPTDRQSMATAFGVSVLEYEDTIPTRFMVGTENGLVIGGNRKGKTPTEQLPMRVDAHTGPVVSLERNPTFPKNFLTVGDWSAKIWTEECRESAMMWTPEHRCRINYGSWSPTRISLIVLSGADGRMCLWDVLRNHDAPIICSQISSEPLMTHTFHKDGHLIALGNKRGDTILQDLSESLVFSDAKDKVLMAALFDRLTKKERILEARLREIKLKLRQAEEASLTGSVGNDDPTLNDKDLADATIEYMQSVKKDLANLV